MSDNTQRNRNWNQDRDYNDYDDDGSGNSQNQQYGNRNYNRDNQGYDQRGIEQRQRNNDRNTDNNQQGNYQGQYRNRNTNRQGYNEPDFPPETSEHPYRTDMPRREVGQYVEPSSNQYNSTNDWQRQGKHTGRGPQGYQRSDDRIAEDVNERLTQHGDIDATNIQVRVSKGEVTLDGTVDSRQTKRQAEDTADGVSGVTHVQNNLRVSDSSSAQNQGSNSMSNQRTSSITSTNGGNSGNGGTSSNGQAQQAGQQTDQPKRTARTASQN